MREWISVKDELPKLKHKRHDEYIGDWRESDLVFVAGRIDDIEYNGNVHYGVAVLSSDDDGTGNMYWHIPFRCEANRIDESGITHWAPIPKLQEV